MTITALLARTEVWAASEQYPARYVLHLVLDGGDFLSLSTSSAVLDQAKQLGPMTRVLFSLSVERTYRDGRVRLRAESIAPPTSAKAVV